MSADEHSTGHIIQSLLVNVAIAVVKAIAAYFTHSGAMMAEALHSLSDCGNQILLLIGVRQAKKPADAEHPLGYGRAIYFWSFLVAVMLFAGGGLVSIWEGVQKIMHPEELHHVLAGLIVLVVSIFLEGSACLSNVRELNKRRKSVPFFRFLSATKDSDLVVVFAENSAAVLGLFFAIFAMLLAWKTGDGRWDGGGSVVIGLVLVGVAVFLAKEVMSLLLGESADPELEADVRRMTEAFPAFERVLNVVTVQQGPGEVLVSLKVACSPSLMIDEVCHTINAFEEKLRALRPEIRWVYVEPDIPFSRRGGAPSEAVTKRGDAAL